MIHIKLFSSLYPSCCYYSLKQSGLLPGEVTPRYLQAGKELSRLGQSFSFKAPMAGGPIFPLVYQIPGYLDVNKQDLVKVFGALKRFVEQGSIQPFQKIWPSKTAYWDLWYTEVWLNYLWYGVKSDSVRALATIEKFFTLIQDIWSEYEQIHLQKLLTYPYMENEKLCNALDISSKWQAELRLNYPYQQFGIVICPESRTLASSLGPEKIVLGAHHKEKDVINACVHEIGVRTIGLHRLAVHPATQEIMRNDYHGILMLIETEVCYHKPNILPELKNDPFIKGMKLEELMAWRTTQDVLESMPETFALWYGNAKATGLI